MQGVQHPELVHVGGVILWTDERVLRQLPFLDPELAEHGHLVRQDAPRVQQSQDTEDSGLPDRKLLQEWPRQLPEPSFICRKEVADNE